MRLALVPPPQEEEEKEAMWGADGGASGSVPDANVPNAPTKADAQKLDVLIDKAKKP